MMAFREWIRTVLGIVSYTIVGTAWCLTLVPWEGRWEMFAAVATANVLIQVLRYFLYLTMGIAAFFFDEFHPAGSELYSDSSSMSYGLYDARRENPIQYFALGGYFEVFTQLALFFTYPLVMFAA